jgi:RNA polymerase sigma-70 factor (ECF subfamily)
MTDPEGPGTPGPFEARYRAFLETIVQLRPALHRYCARMTGSVIDGEDVVQEALFDAYRRLDSYDDSRPLAPWLFRIAHNRCIDVLRRREVRAQAEAAAAEPDRVVPPEPPGPALGRAAEHLVLALPPMERACVLLKDVFDYTIEEIAELVDTTVGGVKAALSRGRAKLSEATRARPPRPPRNAEHARILGLYVERFNARDWDGLRALIADDARLRVADKYAGPVDGSPYFGNYTRLPAVWRLAAGEVDDEPAVVILHERGTEWVPHSFVQLEIAGGRVTRIHDFWHTPWLLPAAASVAVW